MSPQLLARFKAQIQSGDFAAPEFEATATREDLLNQLARSFETAWLYAALSQAADERYAETTIAISGQVKLKPGETVRHGDYVFVGEPDGLVSVRRRHNPVDHSRRRAIQELLLDRLDRG